MALPRKPGAVPRHSGYNDPMRQDEPGPKKPTPEELLARVQQEERAAGRGRLKLFLGFAAGVGKTYEMLAEANRRKHESGQDVVIGYVETHKRKDTEAQIGDLEVVPRRKIEYKGAAFEEMDTDAIIARRPQVGAGGRTGAHQHPRLQAREALPGRAWRFWTPGSTSRAR